MRPLITFFIVSICNLSLASLAYAQDSSKPTFILKPGLVWMENDKPAIGLQVGLKYKDEKTITSDAAYPRIRSLDINMDGSLLINPDMNPNTQKADLFWGYLISFEKSEDITLGVQPESNKDFGSLGLGVDLIYEANQSFTEQNLEGGAELRFQNTSKVFMPVFHAAFRFVVPVVSDIRDVLNEDNELYQRLNLNLSWNIPLFQQKRFIIAPEFNYFYSLNLAPAIENTGLNEGFHGKVNLAYAFEGVDKPVLRYMKHVFIQYNNGQLPVYLDNLESIEAGLTFSL
jgi:hypothetical protein